MIESIITEKLQQDQKHFVRYFLAAQRSIYAYILAFTPKQEEADDILQETAVALWNKFETFDESRASFATWAKSFARLEILKYREKQGRKRMLFDSEVVDLLTEDMAKMDATVDYRHDALKECVEKLPRERRMMIQWRYLEGFTVRQVAEKMGKRMDAVYKTLSRSQSMLLKCIEGKLSQSTSEI